MFVNKYKLKILQKIAKFRQQSWTFKILFYDRITTSDNSEANGAGVILCLHSSDDYHICIYRSSSDFHRIKQSRAEIAYPWYTNCSYYN